MKPYIDLLAEIFQWSFPAIMAFVGVYIGSRGHTKTEILRNDFEEHRRISNLRISAIERCAQLLHADHEHIAAVRFAAISGERNSSSKDPGSEAISLLQIYFPFDAEEPVKDYATNRQLAMEALRQCAIESVFAKSTRMAKPLSGMNDHDQEMVRFRDEAAEHGKRLTACREKIVSELSRLIRLELSKSVK